MCCTPKNILKIRQTKKQIIAIAFLVSFIAAALLSGAFILTHADHTHDHNDVHGACSTCARLQNAENILKLLGTTAICGVISAAWLYTASEIIRAVYSNIAYLTPVTAKTRMNN